MPTHPDTSPIGATTLGAFRAALRAHDRDASAAVDDDLLRQIITDAREESPEAADEKLLKLVARTASVVAHEAILGS